MYYTACRLQRIACSVSLQRFRRVARLLGCVACECRGLRESSCCACPAWQAWSSAKPVVSAWRLWQPDQSAQDELEWQLY